jgi:hypothetical protein
MAREGQTMENPNRAAASCNDNLDEETDTKNSAGLSSSGAQK